MIFVCTRDLFFLRLCPVKWTVVDYICHSSWHVWSMFVSNILLLFFFFFLLFKGLWFLYKLMNSIQNWTLDVTIKNKKLLYLKNETYITNITFIETMAHTNMFYVELVLVVMTKLSIKTKSRNTNDLYTLPSHYFHQHLWVFLGRFRLLLNAANNLSVAP